MKITQGAFSFLPDLTDEQIMKQIQFMIRNGWAVSVEYTDDPHPRNTYWEMWGLPHFDAQDPGSMLSEIQACRAAHPMTYIRVCGFDSTRGVESIRLSFIVHRPPEEPGFRLAREESVGRRVRYTHHAYAADRPEGRRYSSDPG